MSGQKRSLDEDQDPDYANNICVDNKRQKVIIKQAQTDSCERIRKIIKTQFENEIHKREAQIIECQERIHKAREALHLLRYLVVRQYYESVNEVSNPNEQTRLHPAVKKLVGKNTEKTLDLDIPTSNVQSVINKYSNKNPSQESSNSEPSTSKVTKTPRYIAPNPSDKIPPILSPPRFPNLKVKTRIVIGNVSKFIHQDLREDAATHKWMIYVRGPKENPDISSLVKRVRFFLHSSYQPHDVIEISTPPFHLSRRGWGEFPVRVQIHFHNTQNKPIDVIHQLRLDQSYTGLQTLGAETVLDVWLFTNTNNKPEEKKQIEGTEGNKNNEIVRNIENNITIEHKSPTSEKQSTVDDVRKTLDFSPAKRTSTSENKINNSTVDNNNTQNIVTENSNAIVKESCLTPNKQIFVVENNKNKTNSSATDNKAMDIVKQHLSISNNSKVGIVKPMNINQKNGPISILKVNNKAAGSSGTNNSKIIFVTLNNKNEKSKQIVKLIKPISGQSIISSNKYILPSQSINNSVTLISPLPTNSTVSSTSSITATKSPLAVNSIITPVPIRSIKPLLTSAKSIVTVNPIVSTVPPAIATNKKVIPSVLSVEEHERKKYEVKKKLYRKHLKYLEKRVSDDLDTTLIYLFRNLPLIKKDVDTVYKEMHPYVVCSADKFLSFAYGKQKALQASRSKEILKLLMCHKFQSINIWEIERKSVQFGFTPINIKNQPDIEITKEIWETKLNTYTEPVEIMSWLESKNDNAANNIGNDVEIDIEKISDTNNIKINQDTVSIKSDESSKTFETETDRWVKNHIKKIGIQVRATRRNKNVNEILFEAGKILAEELLRRSYAASRDRNSESDSIELKDVISAINSRSEFDLFTNTGLGKDINDDYL